MQENKKIKLSADACALVVQRTALACYGVVGMAGPNGVTLLSHLLPSFLNRQGVEVAITKKGYKINIYIVVEYGTAFKVVAKNLCDMVKYNLKNSFGIDTCGIKVHIKGVRLSR